MDTNPNKVFDEDSIQIDEAEEEALLKSDDELDGVRTKVSISVLRPPSTAELNEDNFLLMNEPIDLDGDDKSLDLEIMDAGLGEGGLEEADIIEPIIDLLGNGNDTDDKSLDEEINGAGLKDSEMMSEGDGDGNGDADADADGDDDDEDDEEDEEEDEELKALKEYQQILKELEKSRYDYDKYVRLCELSHLTGDLETIRKAYSCFAAVYPLTQELWQKFISIEIGLAQSDAEMKQVQELFQKALKDYYSFDLAIQYSNFAQSCADPDAVWQELLAIYGLHFFRGPELYKSYREQYTSGLLDLAEPDNNKKFINSYLAELRYPHHNMEEVYIEFRVFYEKNKEAVADLNLEWSEIDDKYYKAKEHAQKILLHEELLKTNTGKAELFFDYIKDSDKYCDENIMQTLYERMVADCCLHVECWIKYIDFIDYRDEFGHPKELAKFPLFEQTADDICKRATRNCTWSAEVYVKHMYILEKMQEPKTAIQTILENAAAAGFQTPENAVTVWLEYLTYLRRNTNWTEEDQCEILRKNFNLAWMSLSMQWGNTADSNCEILKFWGRLEYGPLRDPDMGQQLWTTVMESAYNNLKSGVWIEFMQLEMRRDLESTRKLFRKALNTPGLDSPNAVASAWERFERCNGTAKTLVNCIKECKRFELHFGNTTPFPSNQKSNPKAPKRKIHQQSDSNEKSAKQAKTDKSSKLPLEKSAKEKEPTFKEHENQEIDLSKDHLRIFLSNLDYSLSEEDVTSNLTELNIVSMELIRSGNGRSRGFGYAELASQTDVEKALKLDRKDISGRPVFISSVLRDKERRQKFKYSADMEPTKLFVKGLPQDTTKEELEEKFNKLGPIKDIRLVYHKSGKFKQIAYVEYKDETSAGRAVLALDQMDLRGHLVSVAISAPPPKPSSKTASAANPVKLLGIPNKRTRNQLEMKPRMTLIPTAVRKNLTETKDDNSRGSSPVTPSTSKSNDDFRKLLLK